jgi:ABC-type uncharacterized transport system auxiliary subunit
MQKILLSSIFLLILNACSTTYPSITQYRIESRQKSDLNLSQSCKKASLSVAQVFVPSSLMSKKMKYVVGKYQEFAYNESEWAESPNRAITDEIVQKLESEAIFTSVESYKSFSRSDYTLESRVDAFSQYFSKDEKSSFVKVAMTFSLIENKTAKIVATKHIEKTRKTQSSDAVGGVDALNETLSDVLAQMSEWISGSCL